jgi:flagellar biosynthetic protein FliR
MTGELVRRIFEQIGFESDLKQAGVIFMLIFFRVVMMVTLVPFIGSKAAPSRARLATSLILSVFIYQMIAPYVGEVPADIVVIFALCLKEAFFGFVIGMITVMVFHALEAAGGVVDAQRGSANAQIFIPQLGQVSIFGLFNFWMSIAFFLSIGGHRYFLEAFFLTFQTVPLLEFPIYEPGISAFAEFFITLTADVLTIAVQLSAPVLIAILLIDLVLGIANKMAPQINVFELGFSLKGYSGPLMICVSLLVLVSEIENILETMTKSVYKVAFLFTN